MGGTARPEGIVFSWEGIPEVPAELRSLVEDGEELEVAGRLLE